MSLYLNPGNSGFNEINNSDYVDKTMLIALINQTIGSRNNLTCISRPRRFGKSYAAAMLCAYYDRSCDSRELFGGLNISKDESYERHLNQYNVICLDITGFKPYTDHYRSIGSYIISTLKREIRELYRSVDVNADFISVLADVVRITGRQFVIIIDEWDSPIRESPENQEGYLDFLRYLFNNNTATSQIFATVYMTGILPIRKDGSRKVVLGFEEYSAIAPRQSAGYFGFHEKEVKALCLKHGMDYTRMKYWYDGYTMGREQSIYNPYSVMRAVWREEYGYYWMRTSAPGMLMTYMDGDPEGLLDDYVRLMAGEGIVVHTDSFQNDLDTLSCKEDVLTLLIHLGYLTRVEAARSYEEESEPVIVVRIPNKEIRKEFHGTFHQTKYKSLNNSVRNSNSC